MKVDHISSAALKQEYNILCQRLLPKPEVEAPFGASWCVVEPGGSTTPHRHSEGETFLLLEGTGQLKVDGVTQTVSKGDVVFLPPQSCHQITNEGMETLRFLSLWWETDSPKGQKTLIYAAPPTPNGDLHLGHLSGPYLAADLARRALKASGAEAFLLCGTDDHQSYVATRAEQLQSDAQGVATSFGDRIERVLSRAGIPSDVFLRPSLDADYSRSVEGFFDGLLGTGHVSMEVVPVLRDQESGRVFIEGMVAGECPHCAEETYANLCEGCGLPFGADELVQPVSLLDGETLILGDANLPVLNLEAFRDRLTAYLSARELPRSIRQYVDRVLAQPLPRIPLAYPGDWGIDFPGGGGLKVHAWAEMAAGYLYGADRVGRPWTDKDVRKVLAFGFDNCFYYLFHLPALWMARGLEAHLPDSFLINHFLNLEGEKFSTSRQHAIWAKDALDEFPLPAIRGYLAYVRPDTPGQNFQMSEFRRFWGERFERPLQEWKTVNAKTTGFPLRPEQRRELEKFERRCSEVDWVRAPGEATRLSLSLLESGLALSRENGGKLGVPLLKAWKQVVAPLLISESPPNLSLEEASVRF